MTLIIYLILCRFYISQHSELMMMGNLMLRWKHERKNNTLCLVLCIYTRFLYIRTYTLMFRLFPIFSRSFTQFMCQFCLLAVGLYFLFTVFWSCLEFQSVERFVLERTQFSHFVVLLLLLLLFLLGVNLKKILNW